LKGILAGNPDAFYLIMVNPEAQLSLGAVSRPVDGIFPVSGAAAQPKIPKS
jgi:hypothetical protein